jgi:hypothetical protein
MYCLKINSKTKQGGFAALFSVMILGLSATFFTAAMLPRLWTRVDSAMQYSKRIQHRLSALSCAQMVAFEIEQTKMRSLSDTYVPQQYEHVVDDETVCAVQDAALHGDQYIIFTTGHHVQHESKTRVMLETRVDAQNFNVISTREIFD